MVFAFEQTNFSQAELLLWGKHIPQSGTSRCRDLLFLFSENSRLCHIWRNKVKAFLDAVVPAENTRITAYRGNFYFWGNKLKNNTEGITSGTHSIKLEEKIINCDVMYSYTFSTNEKTSSRTQIFSLNFRLVEHAADMKGWRKVCVTSWHSRKELKIKLLSNGFTFGPGAFTFGCSARLFGMLRD